MRVVNALLIIISGALILTQAQAHHGWSSYDQAKPVKITTKVVTLKWENPHGEITVTHEGAEWRVVLAPLSRMEARGLKKAAIEPGQTIGIEAYPLRSGEKEMRAERVTAGGKTVELR